MRNKINQKRNCAKRNIFLKSLLQQTSPPPHSTAPSVPVPAPNSVVVIDKEEIIFFKLLYSTLIQCCGAGAGGAEIILGPGAGAGAENKL